MSKWDKVIEQISEGVKPTMRSKRMSEMSDRCYECQGYGDDYYEDEDGNLVCACDDCPFNDWGARA